MPVAHGARMNRTSGFTLIEALLSLVVLSIGLTRFGGTVAS
jgi:prepilin-type N-terminal cleavage/methylation domain-containing protein